MSEAVGIPAAASLPCGTVPFLLCLYEESLAAAGPEAARAAGRARWGAGAVEREIQPRSAVVGPCTVPCSSEPVCIAGRSGRVPTRLRSGLSPLPSASVPDGGVFSLLITWLMVVILSRRRRASLLSRCAAAVPLQPGVVEIVDGFVVVTYVL